MFRIGIRGVNKRAKMIIDGGSSENVASTELVEKLGMKCEPPIQARMVPEGTRAVGEKAVPSAD